MQKLLIFIILIALYSCSKQELFNAYQLENTGDKVISPPKGFPDFYKKYTNANGIPITGSENVQDEALIRARHTIINMLAKRPDLLAQMILNNSRVGIVADEEETSDLPEYADIENKDYFNKRGRGYGGTVEQPFASCAEENIMRAGETPDKSISSRPDRWHGYDVLVHEFAHSIHLIGLRRTDKYFQKKLDELFEKAKQNPLWQGTYAMTNSEEYFAESTQRWFNAITDLSHFKGQEKRIYTRTQLKQYDPKMYELLKTIYNENNWKPIPF